ncbi:MAG: amidoligase family protein [Bacilli bacterium]|nr:amidoligase family protein [Bacilli bacterium]
MKDCFGYGIGYELEAYNMDLVKVKELIPNSRMIPKKKGYPIDYQKYNICEEEKITVKSDTSYGGEVISPILYDEQSVKKSIRCVLEVLKKTHAMDLDPSISSAGLHFHFGLEIFNKDYQNYYRFIKLMQAFSGEIYAFSHSPNEDLRSSISTYASPYPKMGLDHLLKKYNPFNDTQEEDVQLKAYNQMLVFASKSHMYRFTSQTIEVRTCNCPVQEKGQTELDIHLSYQQFMEYFHFYQSLLEYVSSNEYDSERIDYYYEKERANPYLEERKRKEELKRILKLEK